MDVSVVIVSFNAASYLKECLDSIIRFTKNVSYEIIVVDNASTDDSVEVAKSFGKNVQVVVNKDNRGFGVGVNVGLKRAAGKFILVLNPDIKFLEDSISKMMAYMGQHPDVGLAGCQFLDGEDKMLPNGGYFPTLTRLFFWTFFLDDLPVLSKLLDPYHPSANRYPLSVDRYVDWVTGGFMFVRKEMVEKADNFDENIFMYGEEVEWQYRIRMCGLPAGKQGWKIGYTATTKVIHYERKSSGGSPRNAVLGEFRGLKYIYGKYFSGWKQIALGSLLDLAAFNRIILWLLRRNREMVKIYLETLVL